MTEYCVINFNKKKKTLVLNKLFFWGFCSPHNEYRSSCPRLVKLCSDQKFFSFYLELCKNKFKTLIRTTKFKFSFGGLFLMWSKVYSRKTRSSEEPVSLMWSKVYPRKTRSSEEPMIIHLVFNLTSKFHRKFQLILFFFAIWNFC